jgi:hypothetical protein
MTCQHDNIIEEAGWEKGRAYRAWCPDCLAFIYDGADPLAATIGAVVTTLLAEPVALCPYRLQDGGEGRYGPNTCIGGCVTEPECVTGGPFAVDDMPPALAEAFYAACRDVGDRL